MPHHIRSLWPEGIPLPRMRGGASPNTGGLFTVAGEELAWTELLQLLGGRAPKPVELDAGVWRLNDVYRGAGFSRTDQQLFEGDREIEAALDVADAAGILGRLLLTLAVQRCHGAIHNSEVLLRLLYPGLLRRWQFAKRPDVELAVRIPPLLGLTSRTWLDWALRLCYGEVFIAISESATPVAERFAERIGCRRAPNTTRPVGFAAPAVVGAYQLTQPCVHVAIGPLSDSIADQLGLAIDGPEPRAKDEKEKTCARVLLEEYLQPHVQICVEISGLP